MKIIYYQEVQYIKLISNLEKGNFKNKMPSEEVSYRRLGHSSKL